MTNPLGAVDPRTLDYNGGQVMFTRRRSGMRVPRSRLLPIAVASLIFLALSVLYTSLIGALCIPF